jgi:hypothetical protein
LSGLSGKIFSTPGVILMFPRTFIILLFVSPLAVAASWDGYNSPSRFAADYEYRLDHLPLSGSVDAVDIPWSESYWPRNQGSLNLRWNAPTPIGFGYRSPPFEKIKQMTRTELSHLSPAEKFDLARGRYDYPFTTYIRRYMAKRNAKDFEGICDGWTASAIQFKEPLPIDHVNPEGITIPFGSSDIKALISYLAAYHTDLGPIFAGRYCTTFGFGSRCADINPGALHVILANEIGLRKTPFAADVEIGRETWNQPVFAYEFEIVGSAGSSSSIGYLIQGKMHYTDELEISRWEPVTGTEHFMRAAQDLKYVVELDSNHRITGGYWVEGSNHPDLFWKSTKPIVFEGDFIILKDLYRPVGSQ